MFIAFFSEPLICPQFLSSRGRKKKGQGARIRRQEEKRRRDAQLLEELSRESGDKRRKDKETPNFLKDLAHDPGEMPHVQQETPHDPQGTPHEPQAGGQVSHGGSRLKW
jgi:hypothetical protein